MAGHFIFIPAVLLVGTVIRWILGSRARCVSEARRNNPSGGSPKRITQHTSLSL
jgi:hypothetical protein